MSVKTLRRSQIQSQIAEKYGQADLLEKKYNDGIITDADEFAAQMTRLEEIKGLEAQLRQIDDGDVRQELIARGLEANTRGGSGAGVSAATGGHQYKTLGELFTGSEEYLEAERKGVFDSKLVPEFGFQIEGSLMDRLQRKDALLFTDQTGQSDAVSGPFESRTRVPGILPLRRAMPTFLDLVPHAPTQDELIEYVKELTFTNNAATVAEAQATTGTTGTKPQSTMTFDVANTAVQTIAHWMNVTNKMLRNRAGMASIINQRLLLGLSLTLETQIVSGAGTGTDLLGILAAGIQLQGKGSDNIFDAIHKALTKCRVTGFSQPGFIAMHPVDWETVRLTRELGASGGQYLFGPPSQAGDSTMWGIPVTTTLSLSQGTALVGDLNDCTLYERESASVRTGLINDYLIRNMQVVLAEMAAAFVVWRPNSFCKVTGL